MTFERKCQQMQVFGNVNDHFILDSVNSSSVQSL